MLLKTPRLLLREFTEADFEAFASLVAQPEVMRFSLTGPLSKEQAKDYFQKRILDHYKKHEFGLLAVFNQESDDFIGLAGLISQTIDGQEEIEVAYRLNPHHWNRGFATEAAAALCGYAFQHLAVERLISIIDPQNHRSLKVASRVGMHFWKTASFHGVPVFIYSLSKIVIQPFQAAWAEAFEKEKQKLKEAFKGLDIEFYHIGSTSIPNCSAKPIIDILGVTTDVTQVDSYNQALILLGYQPKGEYGMRQRRYFQRRPIDAVNLHIFEETNPETERHLRFCAYLRNHPEKTAEYSALKQNLAHQFSHDIHQYILGKERWIKTIDKAAAEELTQPLLIKKNLSKKKNWSSEEILRAMEANMHLHMTYFAKYLPSLELVFEPDVTVVRSVIPDDTFNYVLFAKFTENNVHNRVAHVVSLYRKRQLPFSWWVGESDTPSQLTHTLLKEGLSLKEENVGMYCELASVHPQSSTLLHFKQVHSSKELKDFCQVIVEIGVNPQALDLVYSQLPPLLYREGSSFEMHIAYLDQRPIVTGVLVLDVQVAGIYFVATLPTEREKGYGTAMMKHLLHRAKGKGYFLATLQASSQGESLYEQLGFKKCCTFKEYTELGRCNLTKNSSLALYCSRSKSVNLPTSDSH